jgi:hypothetical protein
MNTKGAGDTGALGVHSGRRRVPAVIFVRRR